MGCSSSKLSPSAAIAERIAALEAASVSAKDGFARPSIMAHRGACGQNPPHSLSAYLEAVDFGADYVEYDVICTKDGHLVTSHDVTIDNETDAAEVFPHRRAEEHIASAVDGDPLTMRGCFAKDLTLAEIKTLRKREAWPFRTRSLEKAAAEVQRVLTVAEATAALEAKRQTCGRNFGIVAELKRAAWHRDTLGLPLEERLIEDLASFGGPVRAANAERWPLPQPADNPAEPKP